jgi:hypothetical protein
MPRKVRPGTTPVLAQIPDDVHAAADARRRREGVTWSKVITTLLSRWSAGADEAALAKPVKFGRPATPDAEEVERLHEHLMGTSERYRRAATERVVPTKTYRSLGELLAARAAREGRAVAAEVIAAVAALEDEEDGDD